MKIAFSGTHGVGKTTLLNKLKQYKQFRFYNFVSNVTRDLYVDCENLNISTEPDIFQAFVIHRFVYYHTKYTNLIADRSCLDSYAYARYWYKKGVLSDATLELNRTLSARYAHMYDHIFWIPCGEFPPLADGIRSDDEKFQKDVENELLEAMEEFNIKPHRLTGSVEQRAQKVLELTQDVRDNLCAR